MCAVTPDCPPRALHSAASCVLLAEQASSWRVGHLRHGEGSLPDLFFPADRSWLVSALWDDTWTCVGGPDARIDRLERNSLVNARRITRDEDMLPPGLTRTGRSA
jgi:hypothetical protein